MSASQTMPTPAERAELEQLKGAIDLGFRGMDRAFAAIDQAQSDLGRARSDCIEAQALAAAVFNGPGPRAALLPSAYRTAVLESDDAAFLKSVLLDAWKKSDWAYAALASQSAGAPAGGQG